MMKLDGKEYAPLTREDEALIGAKILKYAGSNEKKHKEQVNILILKHLRLVYSIAKQYPRLDFDDAFNVGVLALAEAMQRWRPVDGSMNAYQWAKRYITTALNKATDAARPIRLPEQIAYKAALNTRTVAEKEYALNRKLSTVEVNTLISGPRLEDLPTVGVSLSSTLESGEDLSSTIACPNISTEDAIIRQDAIERLRQSLNVLTEKERIVLEHRHGLEDKERMTLAQLGKLLKVSGEAVRKIEATAMAKLQHPAHTQGVLYEQ